MIKFKKWTSINSFHEVVKATHYSKYSTFLAERDNKLFYRAKIKLHGTNASVTITSDGRVIAGKRSSFLPQGGIGDDNAQFAAWVKKNEEDFLSLVDDQRNITIWGEWCGPGVQDGVACSKTDRKLFYVFAVDFFNEEEKGGISDRARFIDPSQIENLLEQLTNDDTIILPWYCSASFDFNDAEKLRTTVDNINKEVEAIGLSDPFMKEIFEIDGEGEGLIFYPILPNTLCYSGEDLEYFSVFTFKAKAESHRVNKTKVAVAVNPEALATIKNFSSMFCTEQRFQQAFKEAVNEKLDIKLTGEFIKWVNLDIMKESETERASLDIEWKKLSGGVSRLAAEWYKKKIEEILK